LDHVFFSFKIRHDRLNEQELYQQFWDVIKADLIAMFIQLQTRELQLFKLNFGVITLLPKKEIS
jgi:hypothetical protein